jgi:hypothetical protein
MRKLKTQLSGVQPLKAMDFPSLAIGNEEI